MEDSIRFKVTEEVIRQTVEVKFKRSGPWEISFTNPTAGPWKSITIGNYEGGHDLRYDKEEDRPDLILFDRETSSFLIFEAKDKLSKMFSKNQIKKSVDVFVKEINKLTDIIESGDNKSNILKDPTLGYSFHVGYIYSKIDKSKSYISTKRSELISKHKSYMSNYEKDLDSTIHIMVDEEEDRLVPKHKLFGFDSQEASKLMRRLPTSRMT